MMLTSGNSKVATLLGTALFTLGMSACAGEGEGFDDATSSAIEGDESVSEKGQKLTAFAFHELRARHSDKCADVWAASTASNTLVMQHVCKGGFNQHWQVIPLFNGFFQIRARHSGKCLDVQAASTANGAQVSQYDCHGGPNQQWEVRPLFNGFWEIRARHSNKCLDVPASSLSDSAVLGQWECHGGANQQWNVRELF